MPDQTHDHADILRRLDALERKQENLVSTELLDSKLETIQVGVGGNRADITTLEQADQQRRNQMLGVIGAITVALVVGLIQSGVLG